MNLRFLNSGGVWVFFCITTLYCAPDPDLFDGRYFSASSGSSTTGSHANENGADTKNSEGNAGSEGNASSESDEVFGAGDKPSTGTAAEKVAEAISRKPDSSKPGSKSTSAKAPAPASQSARSFEEFEISSSHDAKDQIEIRRSKEHNESPSSAAQTSDQTANSNTQSSDKNAQKSSSTNQEPVQGSGSPDYGKDVPFGL